VVSVSGFSYCMYVLGAYVSWILVFHICFNVVINDDDDGGDNSL